GESLANRVPHSRLPSYLSEAFSDLYEEDGLAVLGRGLGWLGLLASFVRLYGDVEGGYAAAFDDDDETKGDGGEGRRPASSSYSGGRLGVCDDPPGGGPSGGPSAGRKAKGRRRLPLVFVLNLRDDERRSLLATLSSWGTPPDELPRVITNEAGQAAERAALYARGGVFVVTSRILIVDLLTGHANARDIEGMLVAHAEGVCGEKSTEAFILRIFKGQRYLTERSGGGGGGGFVKAFTDDPAALVAGFSRVEKVLRSLHVRRMYLYPRHRASVAEELERRPPEVLELRQPMSDKMRELQANLAAATMACLRDLTAKCHLVDLSSLSDVGEGRRRRGRDDAVAAADVDEFGLRRKVARGSGVGESRKAIIEQCASTNYGRVLQRQLEGDWHKLGRDVKQMVNDLTKLSQLFHYLIEYDCVQFWRVLENLKSMSAASRHPSGWMLQEAGERIFRLAKERCYRLDQAGRGADGKPIMKLKRVLEDKPKEALLHQVLTEVENRWRAKAQKAREAGKDDGSLSAAGANVLLVVKDERALRSVQSYLSNGGRKRALAHHFLDYLDAVVERVKPTLRSGGHDQSCDGLAAAGFTLDSLPVEKRLLCEEQKRVYNFLYGAESRGRHNRAVDEDRKKLSDWKRKHKRVVEERTRGVVAAEATRGQADLEEAVEASRGDAKAFDEFMVRDMDGQDQGSDQDSSGSWSSEDEDELAYKVEPIVGLRLHIQALSKLAQGEAPVLLHDVRPDYVVMYDSDPSFIRTLEVYSNSMEPQDNSAASATTKEDRLQVFFLLYEASAEDSKFMKSLDKEKKAFDKLIDHQKRMPTVMPALNFSSQAMQQAQGGVGGSYAGGTLPLSMDTRSGGGKLKCTKERRDIAVDVREFRAALPNILHQGGMRLAPAQLIVGDFILSNVHCVERKSLSDLYGSFNSGRLYDQVEAMVKHYKCPCLLIEFDPEKNFSLQSTSDLGGEIRNDSITSKLTLLTMKFPQLRLLWSRSPHETLKIFKKLKRNHQEVDVEKAIEIGTNDALDELLLGGEDGYYNDDEESSGSNDAAKAMLLRLPGVNVNNARKIMSECDSIADLSQSSREELRRIAGPVVGQKLFSFFRQRFSD
ncbi:hypothetical protein ACHAWF_016750, partial [Thalassiosira exigua]